MRFPERGVRNVIVRKGFRNLGFPVDVNVLSIDNTLEVLPRLGLTTAAGLIFLSSGLQEVTGKQL